MDPAWGNWCFQKQQFLSSLEGCLLRPKHSRGGHSLDFGKVEGLSGVGVSGAWKDRGGLGICRYLRPPQQEEQGGGVQRELTGAHCTNRETESQSTSGNECVVEPGLEPWSGQAHSCSPGLSVHGNNDPSLEQGWGGVYEGESEGPRMGLSFLMGARGS